MSVRLDYESRRARFVEGGADPLSSVTAIRVDDPHEGLSRAAEEFAKGCTPHQPARLMRAHFLRGVETGLPTRTATTDGQRLVRLWVVSRTSPMEAHSPRLVEPPRGTRSRLAGPGVTRSSSSVGLFSASRSVDGGRSPRPVRSPPGSQ